MSNWHFILKNRVIKWPSYSLNLNPIKNMCGNIKRYIRARTYKDIKSLKEDILDQLYNLDVSYWMYLTESIRRRVDTWILRNRGLTDY